MVFSWLIGISAHVAHVTKTFLRNNYTTEIRTLKRAYDNLLRSNMNICSKYYSAWGQIIQWYCFKWISTLFMCSYVM